MSNSLSERVKDEHPAITSIIFYFANGKKTRFERELLSGVDFDSYAQLK